MKRIACVIRISRSMAIGVSAYFWQWLSGITMYKTK